MNLEDFRYKNGLTIREICSTLGINGDSYELVKGEDIKHYVMHSEICEALFAELDLVFENYGFELSTKQKWIIMNTVRCDNEKIIDTMYLLSNST